MGDGGQVADHLDAVVANVPGAVYRCRFDDDWTMSFLSDEIERLSGYPASDFIGNRERTFSSIIHPADRDEVTATVARAVATGEPFAPEYRIIRADGAVVWVLERGRGARQDATGGSWLDGVIFDVTARKVLEEELKRSLADAAVAQERLRLARELHDSIGHAVSVGAIQAAAARSTLRRDPDAAQEALTAVEACLRTALEEMREMVTALNSRPAIGRRRPRVADLVERASSAGVDVSLTVDGPERSLPPAVEVSLYRTAQECLTNCMKYAAGAAVTVALSYRERSVELLVSDDGLRAADAPSWADSAGLGLEGLRDRAASLGGAFKSGLADGGGFQVSMTLPTD